jgi:hypothetical protein
VTAPSGNGNATLTVTAQTNASAEPRTATINVAGATLTVIQYGSIPVPQGTECKTLRLQRQGDQTTAVGLSGPTSVGVFADRQCGWTAKTDATWVTLTSGAAGYGNGTLSYIAQPNDGDARSALIKIGDQDFNVNQMGNSTNPSTPGNDGGGDSGGSSGGDSGGDSG